MSFRLLFNGVEKSQYPNGTRFTPADIVATPVMEEVYRRNGLEQYLKFDDFKATFTVVDKNLEFDRLRREFAARFDDHRLQPTDRNQLEDEYASKLKSITNNEFALIGSLNAQFARPLPKDLTDKVMNDILMAWAERSRALGTFLFDVDVFSDNLVQDESLKDSDYLVLTDRLRVMINRISKNMLDLGTIPGARLIRVGEHNVSLGEMQASLQDSLDFRLTAIQGPIYSFGLYKNRTLAEIYVGEHLFQLGLEAQEIANQSESVDRALSNYVASRAGAGGRQQEAGPATAPGNQLFAGSVIPQISDSFIDRVVNLSTQTADVSFRQELSREAIGIGQRKAKNISERQLYERMKSALSGSDSSILGARREEVLRTVAEEIKLLIADLKNDLHNIQLLHKEISQRCLQPSMIYTIVEPFNQERVSAISMRVVVLLAGFVWCVFVGFTLVVIAGHAMFVSRMSSRAAKG